jgi:hypothetical protein
MPSCWADRAIMFSVIALVAWALIGLPLIQQIPSFYYGEPAKVEHQLRDAGLPAKKTVTEKGEISRHGESKWYGTFLEHTPDWFVAIFTALLAYVTYRLVQSTNKLWDAATKAAAAQEKDIQIIQRAYLSVEPAGIHPFLDGSPRLVCNITIRNAGNLPARGVSWYIDRTISSESNLRTFAIPVHKQEGSIFLAPRAAAVKGCAHLAKTDILNRRMQSDFWFYIWGRVEYDDGFRSDRFIEFCHRYNIAAADGDGRIDEAAARYHEHGNSTDDSF